MTRPGGRSHFSVLAAPRDANALRSAIDTLIRQDFQDFEVVFVDDGAIKGLAETVTRDLWNARILRVENGSTLADAFNKAAAFASGSYLAFLETDDVWHPRYLSYQNAVFESIPDALYSRAGYGTRDLGGDGFLPAAPSAADAPDAVLELLASADLPTLSCLTVPRSVLLRMGGLDAGAGTHFRTDLEIRLLGGLRTGGPLACVEHPAPRIPQVLVLRRLAQEADDMADAMNRWSAELPGFIRNLYERPFMKRFQGHRDWFEARVIERHCATLRAIEASLRIAA